MASFVSLAGHYRFLFLRFYCIFLSFPNVHKHFLSLSLSLFLQIELSKSVAFRSIERRATVSKMPFVQRVIEPVFLSRPTQPSQSIATATVTTANDQPTTSSASNASKAKSHDDFTAIANCTLANILRQLASVVLVADEILSDLGNELQSIRDRSTNIQKRIVGVEKTLENVDTTIICKCFSNFGFSFYTLLLEAMHTTHTSFHSLPYFR